MNLPAEIDLWSVPPIWSGETIVILACGPSLTQEQVDQCRENARIIAINDSYRLHRAADILYACDARWWEWYYNAIAVWPEFLGVKIGLAWDAQNNTMYPGWNSIDATAAGIFRLAATGETGLESDPQGLRTGKNSGYQAINLAVHLGAERIVLLGYDMQAKDGKHHWFGNHPDNVPPPPYELFMEPFESLVEPLKELKIEIYNATPDSALECFPKVKLEEVV